MDEPVYTLTPKQLIETDEPVYTLTPKQLIETLERAIAVFNRQHGVYHVRKSKAAELAINQVMTEIKPDRQLQAELRS